MREQIAMLDGLSGGLGLSDPYAQDYSEFDSLKETTPVPGGGQNYTGGSTWFDKAPYMLQQEGLAGLGSLAMDPAGYAGSRVGPVPGNGQNYTGGASWAPGFPTLPSSEGLAAGLSIENVPGYAGSRYVPVPGGGQNYTGGSDWAPGFPTSVSSQGLVGLGRLRGVSPHVLRSWARCGAVFALRAISDAPSSRLSIPRRLRAAGMDSVDNIVNAALNRGFPRGVAFTQKSVAYFVAYFVVIQAGGGARDARPIALRAIQAC